MPEVTNHTDIIIEDWLEYICTILNKYQVGRGIEHVYSVQNGSDGQKYILDSTESTGGELDVGDALSGLDALVSAELGEIKEIVFWVKTLRKVYEEKRQYAGYSSYAEYLGSAHWAKVRAEAIERAGGRCMLCNTDKEGLHVHHRTYEQLGAEEAMDVIVLCASHHAQFHGKGGGE